MFRIDSTDAVNAIPTPAAVGDVVGYFSEGDPNIGQQATVVSADWLNAVQEELANVIEGAGVTLDKTVRTQLYTAIKSLVKVPIQETFTSNGTVAATTQTVFIDCTSGNVTVTLPAASSGRRLKFVRKDTTSNVATISRAGSDTILGETSVEIVGYGSKLELEPSGTVWY